MLDNYLNSLCPSLVTLFPLTSLPTNLNLFKCTRYNYRLIKLRPHQTRTALRKHGLLGNNNNNNNNIAP